MKIKDSIDDLRLSFDVIAVSETWAETYTINGFTLRGYKAFHIIRAERKGNYYCPSSVVLHCYK